MEKCQKCGKTEDLVSVGTIQEGPMKGEPVKFCHEHASDILSLFSGKNLDSGTKKVVANIVSNIENSLSGDGKKDE